MMNATYRFCHTLTRFLAHVCFDYEVLHPERLITGGPVLIVANHSSYLDPPLVGVIYDQPIKYLARKTLFTGGGAWLYPRLGCVPVDQDGPDFSALKNIINLLKQGEPVLLFPEGERTLTGQPMPGQPGVGLVIARAQVPVQPIRLVGAYEAFPRGSATPNFRRVKAIVGEPLYFSPERLASRSKTLYQELSDECMAAICALREE
jgi:1-acyl-sn-glycerol-3-phosphate acyltransferase